MQRTLSPDDHRDQILEREKEERWREKILVFVCVFVCVCEREIHTYVVYRV